MWSTQEACRLVATRENAPRVAIILLFDGEPQHFHKRINLNLGGAAFKSKIRQKKMSVSDEPLSLWAVPTYTVAVMKRRFGALGATTSVATSTDFSVHRDELRYRGRTIKSQLRDAASRRALRNSLVRDFPDDDLVIVLTAARSYHARLADLTPLEIPGYGLVTLDYRKTRQVPVVYSSLMAHAFLTNETLLSAAQTAPEPANDGYVPIRDVLAAQNNRRVESAYFGEIYLKGATPITSEFFVDDLGSLADWQHQYLVESIMAMFERGMSDYRITRLFPDSFCEDP